MDEFKSQMMNKFEMSHVGLLHYFLRLQVHQAEDEIFLSERRYVEDLLTKSDFFNCKPATTPINVDEKMQPKNGAKMDDARSFKSMVGGLIFLTHTHPGIAFFVGVISRFMQEPSKVHFWSSKKSFMLCRWKYGLWDLVFTSF